MEDFGQRYARQSASCSDNQDRRARLTPLSSELHLEAIGLKMLTERTIPQSRGIAISRRDQAADSTVGGRRIISAALGGCTHFFTTEDDDGGVMTVGFGQGCVRVFVYRAESTLTI